MSGRERAQQQERLARIGVVLIALALVVFAATDVRRRGEVRGGVAGAAGDAGEAGDAGTAGAADAGAGLDRARPFGITNTGHRTDLTAYTAAARVWAEGGSSQEAYAAKSPRGWRYQYPPLLGALMMPLSLASPPTQSLLWGLLGGAMVILLLFECRAWCRVLDRPRDAPESRMPWIVPVAVALAALLPILNTLQRGQVGVLVVLPLMCGFRLMWCGPAAWVRTLGGVLLAFPAVVKFIPLAPVGTAAAMVVAAALAGAPRRPSGPGAAALGGLALGFLLWVLLVPAALLGWQRNLDGLRIFMDGVVGNDRFAEEWEFDIHSVRNQSLENALYRVTHWGEPERPALPNATPEERAGADPGAGGTNGADDGLLGAAVKALRVAFAGLTLVVASLLVLRPGRAGRTRGAFAGFGLACLLTLVVSPVSWGHHFVILVPALLGTCGFLEAAGRSVQAALLAGAMAFATLLHYAAMGVAGPAGVLGLVTAAVMATALGWFAGEWWAAYRAGGMKQGSPHSSP